MASTVLSGILQELSLTPPDRLIFQDQGRGDQRNPTLTDPLQDGEGCSSPGPQGRDDDIRIQDDRVHGAGCVLPRLHLAALDHTKCLPGRHP